MTEISYDNIPGVDSSGNFPPFIRQLIADSPEVGAKIVSEIADSDVVEAAAVEAMSEASVQAQLSWQKTMLPPGTDWRTLTVPGIYPILGFSLVNSIVPKLPVIASGYLHVTGTTISRIVTWKTAAAPRQEWDTTLDGGVWSAFHRQDRPLRPASTSLTRSQGSSYAVAPALSSGLRHPFRLNNGLNERFRVKIRNFEERTSTAGTATVAANGLWIGEAALDANGELTGQFKSAPTKIADAFTISSAWVFSAWIDWMMFNFKPGVVYLVAFGYDSDGTGLIHRSRGYVWANGASASASQAPTSGSLTATTLCPFMVEIEVESEAPRVPMIGDSHVAGNNARYPVLESPIALAGIANGFTPINMGHGGSKLSEWRSVAQAKWQDYGITAGSGAEAVVIWLGQNDVFDALSPATLAAMKADYIVVVNSARITFDGAPIYAGTLLPRNGVIPAGQDQVRKDFNAWLRTLPAGIAGVWDVAAAVTDPATGLVRSDYIDADLTHLNTAGCDAAAQSLRIRPRR